MKTTKKVLALILSVVMFATTFMVAASAIDKKDIVIDVTISDSTVQYVFAGFDYDLYIDGSIASQYANFYGICLDIFDKIRSFLQKMFDTPHSA